ncbi:restriction endonuclease subunit S [Shewanella algae]|nr:restriction endonuclease subunit S [Shewanella algae]
MSNQVPEGWKLSKIAEISSILDSKRVPLNSQERAKRVGEYPYYGANGVQGYIDDFIFEGEHVLLAEDGGNFEQWATRPISYLVDGKFWVNNHAHILKAKKNHSTKFIHYSLVHKNILKHINGGTRAKLNQADMRDIQVLCPPFPEQQKIAKILTSVDEVIEKTQAQIDKLKDLKTGMMQELLTQGVGVDGKPHTEFKDSPVGRIPKAWEVVTLGDITIDSAFGPRFSSNEYAIDGNIGCIRTTDMDENWDINYATAPRAKLSNEEFEKHFLEEGDLLVTRSGTCGLVDVFKQQSLPMIAAAFLIRFRLLATVNPHFVRYLMMSSGIQENIQLLASGGVQKNLSGSSLKTLKLPMPDIDEQSKIVNVIESINRRLFTLNRKQIANQQLKKALMQDLLTGKVRVTID